MKKTIDFLKKYQLIGYFLGILSCITVVVIAESINSNEVLYDNSSSNTSFDNVQDAIDDLYNIYDHSSLGFSLLTHTPTGLSTSLVAGMYRYQGTTANNYICFGTTNKNDCVSDTDKYMYRIIGINESGELKLIKKEALNTSYQWSSPTGSDWAHCILFTNLNGSAFLENLTYIPDNTWSARITNSDWHYYTSSDSTASTIAERELEAPTVSAKIGLISLTDYAYVNITPTYSNTSWIELSKNDSGAPNGFDWSITSYNSIAPWHIGNGGVLGSGTSDAYADARHSVRPVFFLSASETIASGSGTITDPYILS